MTFSGAVLPVIGSDMRDLIAALWRRDCRTRLGLTRTGSLALVKVP
jgi:hypothetical protein